METYLSRSAIILLSEPLRRANVAVRSIKNKRNQETRDAIKQYLADQFAEFATYKSLRRRYAPGSLASTLQSESLIDSLNEDDRKELSDFIPKYLPKVPGSLQNKNRAGARVNGRRPSGHTREDSLAVQEEN